MSRRAASSPSVPCPSSCRGGSSAARRAVGDRRAAGDVLGVRRRRRPGAVRGDVHAALPQGDGRRAPGGRMRRLRPGAPPQWLRREVRRPVRGPAERAGAGRHRRQRRRHRDLREGGPRRCRATSCSTPASSPGSSRSRPRCSIELPKGPRATRHYVVRTSDGRVSFWDTSANAPKAFSELQVFTRKAADAAC